MKTTPVLRRLMDFKDMLGKLEYSVLIQDVQGCKKYGEKTLRKLEATLGLLKKEIGDASKEG